MAASTPGGTSPPNQSKQRRRIVIGIGVLIAMWTFIDEFYPKFFARAAKTATIIGNMQFSSINGPATVEIGSLFVQLPSGDTHITRMQGPESPYAGWRPTTKQWAHMIHGPSREQLGMPKEPVYLMSVMFKLRPKENAAVKASSCLARKAFQNGDELAPTEDTQFAMYSALRRVKVADTEWAVPRQNRKFLGQDLIFFRLVMTPQGVLPGRASLGAEIALAHDVALNLHIRDADIDAETFWATLTKIENTIRPMLRRVDGRPLDQSAELMAQCDAHHAAQAKQ